MRVLVALLVVSGFAQPLLAARQVTVEQLEQILAGAQSRSDSEVARQLADLDLSERLTSGRLSQLKADVPGERSRQALVVLADSSAFLKPPASEIPATATPTSAAQHRMMAMTVDYLGKSLPLLPNLFATRDTQRFENRPASAENVGAEGNPLRPVGRSVVTVLYRDNQEFVDAGAKKDDQPQLPDKGLTTWGEFGPILGTVLIDAARSKLAWSHWELGASGPEAVFRYAVPKEKSNYDVRYCCVSESYGLSTSVVRQRAGYHGEITVDPANGAILRLTLEADLDAGNPISQAEMAVEYGAVEIGNRSYICPVHSVALATSPDLKKVLEAHTSLPLPGAASGPGGTEQATITVPPHALQQTLLNDVSFRQYHLFRAESRIVTGNEKETASSAATPAATSSEPEGPTPTAATARPSAEVAAETIAAGAQTAASPQSTTVAASAGEPTVPAVSQTAAAPVVLPEISLAEATGLPKEPYATRVSLPGNDAGNGFTLRMMSRLVDLGVVALDKKGRPIANLKPEDFEIYDNGVKQDVRSFGQTGATAVQEAEAQPAAQVGPALSNHRVATRPAGDEGNTIVLLVDGSNLAINDFADARQEMVRFIKTLPPAMPVALYALSKYGFKVLNESSTDHEALAAQLAKWVPSAQDISEAQFNEDRNRQNLDTVHSPEDLLSVNGYFNLDTGSQSEALDPKLRPMGSNPPRSALAILVDVARRLAPIPGHKSLIWVTSDNVLADWDQGSIDIQKGAKFIQPVALRVQEAMNNAHVSVYPLDASRLEGAAVDASKYGRNVELTPTYQMPAQLAQALQGPEASSGPVPISLDHATDMGRDLTTNRLYAQMQQDMHGIQGVFREVADATGGQAFRRSNNVMGELNSVVADGRATYLLGFSPSEQADGKYHQLTVKVINHKDVALRYRTGFQYDAEPATVKDRFTKAVWQAIDSSDIAVSGSRSTADAATLHLKIAAADLALAQDGDLWTDRLDVYLVRRDDAGHHARVSGQTMTLRLKGETYQKLLHDGIPFEQVIESAPDADSTRIVVVDENSGRMGTLTVPAPALMAKQ